MSKANPKATLKTTLNAIFPKWAKISLVILSIIASVGIISAIALDLARKNKIYTANISLHDKNDIIYTTEYTARIHFQSLKPLLRSKHISTVSVLKFLWSENIKSADFTSISHSGQSIYHIRTTQDLVALGDSLGQVEYEIDFTPLLFSILKYYFGILLIICAIALIISGTLGFRHIAYALVAFGIVVRIYQYIFHKDLWLDEAAVAYSAYGIGWSELFFQALPNLQSAPFLFLVVSKFLGSIFGYGEHTLYFLPCVFGIATLILALKIAKLLFGNKTMGFLAFVVLVCGSLGLLYYSAEFKQYGIEAFCGFLLIYCYLKHLAFKKFIAISVLCFLSSHTGIFVAFACIAGYFYKTFSMPFSLKSWIKSNSTFIFLSAFLALLFIIYYFGYIRYQAVDGFYNYWKQWLIPLNPLELPNFFVKILPVYSGFTPFDCGNIIPLYMLVSCVGLYALWQNKRDMFVVCAGILVIYVGLSVCQIYPFGHGGIIGGRLSLFMSVFFYIMCASGVNYLYDRFSAKWWRELLIVCILGLAIFGAYKNAQKFLPEHRHIQQTHDFITQIAKEYQQSKLSDSAKCVFVYSSARYAFFYYSYIDNLTIPHKIFDEKFNVKDTKFYDFPCQKIWILASHYWDNWEKLLIAHAKSLSKNAEIKESQSNFGSSMLIRIER
ncbi:glycosyltransferase family 39 protein [Helicobacter sp. MIT 01-3238]|uniref:glycosyltransferase family 39 protein n=1 Tax=Helicobacter sp. MIT 01-3238 TaxID=398627 RepID=UPI000E1F5412|nr:glycosyltransferase family 39 protein [Helicobacter sp. MIT 01-3238]RDU54511.1 hypothetical protein CQA40_03030 [Helicobacter sp. MIT 01-3238]